MASDRVKLARNIEKIMGKRISVFSGFHEREHDITEIMVALAEEFPQEVENSIGVKPLRMGGGLWQDYDQKLYRDGIYLKRYQYEYLIPHMDNGEERHFRCKMTITKEWYKDDRGTPEMWGNVYCDVTKHGDKELEHDLHDRGLVIEQYDDTWRVSDINEVLNRSRR